MSKNPKSLVLYLFSNDVMIGTGAKGRTNRDKKKVRGERKEKQQVLSVAQTFRAHGQKS